MLSFIRFIRTPLLREFYRNVASSYGLQLHILETKVVHYGLVVYTQQKKVLHSARRGY